MQTNNGETGGGMSKKLVWGIVAAVVAVMIFGVSIIGAVGYAIHLRQERKAASEREMNEFVDSVKQQADAIKEIQNGGTDTSKLDAAAKKPVGQGFVGQFQGLLGKFMKEAGVSQVAFGKQIDESGLPTLLDAERLGKDADLTQSRKIIADARKITLEFHAKMRGMITKLKAEVAAMPMSAEERKGVNAGLESGLGQSMKRTERIWALDLKMYGDMDKIIALLSKKPRAWEVTDGQIMFQNEADHLEYETLLKLIDKGVQEQTDLQKEAMDSVDENIKKMKQRP